MPNIAFVGFGEAAGAFAEGLSPRKPAITACDIKTNDPANRDGMMARFRAMNVKGCNSAAEAVADAEIIFSFVTADQALAAAQSVMGHCKPDTLYFDCNSCAPETKRKAAELLTADGIGYVDAAVMSPVHPRLHRTPINISGPHSKRALEAVRDLCMNITVLEGDIGTASATKMIRSIMMKGLEATMMECVLAARKTGVDELVLDSLDATYPGFNFREKATYMLERVMVHGVRRAAEMRESALTVDRLGLTNDITQATVNWQQAIGDLNLDPDHTLGDEDYGSRADAILAALANTIKGE